MKKIENAVVPANFIHTKLYYTYNCTVGNQVTNATYGLASHTGFHPILSLTTLEETGWS